MAKAYLDLQITSVTLEEAQRELGEYADQAPRLLTGALNRTLRRGKTQVKRAVQEILTLKAGSIDSRIKPKFATKQTLSGRLEIKEAQPPNLMSFRGARATAGKGIIAQLRVGEAPERNRHGFLAAGPNNKSPEDPEGVQIAFERRLLSRVRANLIRRSRRNLREVPPASGGGGGKDSDAPRVGRLPIFALLGPSPVGLLLQRPGFAEARLADLDATLRKNVDGVIRGFLDKKALQAAKAQENAE